jgi:hypothetical protein
MWASAIAVKITLIKLLKIPLPILKNNYSVNIFGYCENANKDSVVLQNNFTSNQEPKLVARYIEYYR